MGKCFSCGMKYKDLDYGTLSTGQIIGYCEECQKEPASPFPVAWTDAPAFLREQEKELRMARMMGRE